MKRTYAFWATVFAAVTLAFSSTGCAKLQARDHLNKGVQAFKAAKYNDAIENFKKSIELDSTFPTARLYLATAYRSQWTPGATNPENLGYLNNAKTQFLEVLKSDPNNKVAIAQMASINYDEVQGLTDQDAKHKKLDEASEWYSRLSKVNPNDAQALYSMGVITWAKWYPVLGKARAEAGMKPEDPGPLKDKKARERLRAEWGPQLDQGIAELRKALEIDKEYDDAMAYMNLLIREKADLAETKEEYLAGTAEADKWVERALDTKKRKAEKALNRPGGVQLDK